MKEEIANRVSDVEAGEGDYASCDGRLFRISCDTIQGEPVNNRVHGSFIIESEGDKPIRGKVIVIDPRMHVSPVSFQAQKVEISYWFEKAQWSDAESISGSFMVVTNHGECDIPYTFIKPENKVLSSIGEIRNMFHFTNLAKINWQEAYNLYCSDDFLKVLRNCEHECIQLYRGLSGRKNEQFMDEFLQAVNKKKYVTYEVTENELLLKDITETYKEEIEIRKKGWGYTKLKVEAKGDFLKPDKEVIREDDFMGSVHRLKFFINHEKLHQGRNWGKLTLSSPYEKAEISIQVYQNGYKRIRQAVEKRRNAKWLNSRLTGLYMSFRNKQIGTSAFKKESEELLEVLQKLDERNPLIKLYGAHLLITGENYELAGQFLNRAEKYIQEEKNPVTYAYYLYLTTLVMKDEEHVRDVRDQVEVLYLKYNNLWQISWLTMFLSRELVGNAQKKWDFLMEVLKKGCTAPAMYLEAALLLNYQPTLLMELGKIEIRILRFIMKKKLLSEGLKGVVLYLIQKEREYTKSVYELCASICKEDESKESLQAMSGLLIKGNKIGEKYVLWYEKSILADVRLTRLYEYYMMSLPSEKQTEIPKRVLMYFSYQKEITQEYGPLLYRYIYDNRDSLQELYISYFPKMERFLLRKLYSGKIDENLGYLYERLLFPGMITEDNARAFAKVMFFHYIPVPDSTYKELIVLHSQEKKGRTYEVIKGLKKVEIFNDSHYLFWEDEEGNRFADRKKTLPVSYFDIAYLAGEAGRWVANEPGLALSFCQNNNSWQTINWYTEAQFVFLTKNEDINDNFRKEMRAGLLEFYYEQEAMEKLDAMLKEADLSFVSPGDRHRLVWLLIVRDFYQKAYEFVKEYTPEAMSPGVLVRLCDYIIEEGAGEEDVLLWYAYTAFRKGKYNISILQYLILKFNGTSGKMGEIFKAGRDFEIETYDLSERIIKQILTTRENPDEETEIFKSYVSGGAGTNLEAAYLTYRSLSYMRDDRYMDFYFIRDIERVHRRGFLLPLVVHLAYLRFFAENKEKRKYAAEDLLKEYLYEIVIDKEMKLPFTQEYADVKGLESLGDRTVLSYKTSPGTSVLLHYRINRGRHTSAFQVEEMEEVYFGVYTKEFILFYGEELQYYITEMKENREQLTKSGSISCEESENLKKDSRYQLINEITMAEQLDDFTSLDSLLEEYWIKEFIAEAVFML